MSYADFYNKLDNANKVLIGIGSGLDVSKSQDFYDKLSKLIEGKDYFIVNLSTDNNIKKSPINLDAVAIPLDDSIPIEENENKWNAYTNWLQTTLNRDMVLIELGVGFDMPTLLRWPFEKIATLNNKAFLYRVNDKFPQLPDNIGQKGESYKISPIDFINDVFEERYGN